MTQCTSTAELIVAGRVVGFLQCTEPAGHDAERPFWLASTGRFYDTPPAGQRGHAPRGTEPGTPHRAALTWTGDGDVDEAMLADQLTLPTVIDLADDDEPDELCGDVVTINYAGAVSTMTCRNLAGHEGAHHDERERATWPRIDEPTDPGPHPESVAGIVTDMLRRTSAHLDGVTTSVPVPGLCGVEGCVYLDGHRTPARHSWQLPALDYSQHDGPRTVGDHGSQRDGR